MISEVSEEITSAEMVSARPTPLALKPKPAVSVSSNQAVTTRPVPVLPDPGDLVSGAVAKVRSALTAMLGGSGTPAPPVVAPVVWTLAAAARRELIEAAGLESQSTAYTLSAQAAGAAAVSNLPPIVGEPVLSEADPTTGAVSGQLVAVDPEGKKLSFALVAGPAEGRLVFDHKTATFSYTPTAAQRVLAGVPTGAGSATFTVTVSDGVKANIRTEVVEVPIAPTQVAEINKITTGVGAAWVAVTNTRAWVTNYDARTVSVIDTISGVKIADIELDTAPAWVAVTPDGKKVYVVDDSTSVITVIDGVTNAKLAPIDFGANRFPYVATVSPDSKTLYVSGGVWSAKLGDWTNVVTKVSTASGKITGTVNLPGYPSWVNDITVSADGKKIYVIGVADFDDDTSETTLYTFGSGSSTGKAILGVGTAPVAVAVSSDSSRAYVADSDSGVISVLDTKTNKVIGTIDHDGWPSDLEVSRDGTLLAVFGHEAAPVKVYDTRTLSLVRSVPTTAQTGDFGSVSASSPDGMQFYFTSNDALHVVSLVPANAKPTVGNSVSGTPNATSGVIAGTVGVIDSDNDPLSYTVTGGPGKGKVVVNPDGSFTYTPTAAARHAAATGAADALKDSFVVTVSDGRRGIGTQLITVDVLGANVDPTGKAKPGKPSSSTGEVKGSVAGADRDKDVLSYSVTTDPAKGGVTIDAKGRFVYTPTAEARHDAAARNGTPGDKLDTFTVTVADGHGGTVDVPVTVSISAANKAPDQAAVSGLTTAPDTGRVSGNVTAVDVDGDAFSFSAPASTKKGAISVNPDGSFTYTPTVAARTAAGKPGASNAAKTDNFTVTVSDGHGGLDTVAVKVTIKPPTVGNRLPAAGKPASANTVNTATGVVSGQVNVTDPDGQGLTYVLDQTVAPADGSVLVNRTTGAFTYLPSDQARFHAWFTKGDDAIKFTVKVSDGVDATLVDVVAPVSPVHPDQDGTLDADDLKALVAAGAIEVAQNEFGGISAIDGRFSSMTVTDQAGAAAVLNSIAAHLDAPAGFVQEANVTVLTNGGEKFYRATQTVNGVVALGSEVILATDAAGKVTGVFSGYDRALEVINTVPAAALDTVAEANVIATVAIRGELLPTADPSQVSKFLGSLTYESDLVVYALDKATPASLAWRVTVFTTPPDVPNVVPAEFATFYIVANGTNVGTVIEERSPFENASASQTAHGYRFIVESKSGKQVLIDASRNITTEAVLYSYEWDLFKGGRWAPIDQKVVEKQSGWAKSAVAAHANVASAYDFYTDVLGHKSFDKKGAPIRVVVEWPEKDNAFGSMKAIGFGSGGHQYAEDIVAHEYTHGVIQYIVGGGKSVWNYGEAGSLNEAYGDIFGSLIEGQPRTSAERWLFGEDADPINARVAIRSMKDPGAFVESSSGIVYSHDWDSRYQGSVNNFGQHINSTIFSHAAYRMIMDPQEGSVRGWGRTAGVTDAQWAKVFYGSLYRLHSGATFVDARSAVISSAKTQGFSLAQIEAIQDAFDHVGIRATNYALGAYDTLKLCGTNSTCAPKDLALSTNGNRAFVLVGNTVKIVETNSLTGPSYVDVTVGSNPTGIAVSSDGSRAFVANTGSGTVSIVQKLFGVGATATVTTVAVGSSPTGIALSANGTRAYVTNSGSGTVSIIDYSYSGSSSPTVRTVVVGSQPAKVAISADGNRAYVTNSGSGTVSLISYNGGAPTVQTIAVGSGPREVAVSVDGSRALVYGSNGSVYVIKADLGATPTSMRVPGSYTSYTSDGFIALSGDGTRGYVTDHGAKLVGIIDLTTATPAVWSVYLTEDLGNDYPHSVATTTSGTRGFVVTHNKLYVVDARTHEYYTANIPLGINNNASDFQQVAVSSNGAYVIATDISGTLTILNATAF